MASESIYGAYRDLLCGGGLSKIVMGGTCISWIPKSDVKGLLNQS